MVTTVDTDPATTDHGSISPIFGDIAAKMQLAAKLEIERRLRLGLPVIVSTENGIEDLSARPSRPNGAEMALTR